MSYTPHAIDPNTLSYLNVEHDGTVVTAAVWRALWGAVYNSLNAMNDFCVEINPVVDNWQEATEQLLAAAQRLRDELEAVQAGLVHYGDNPPENPDIKLWIKPTQTRWNLLEVLAAANQSATEAAASEYEASLSANQASSSASTAQTNAVSAESYAKGGTGIRQGEDTDNAMYYMRQAGSAASSASTYATYADAANRGAAEAASYAVEARGYAETAKTAAEAAQIGAETAAASAASSATAASGSAATAVISASDAQAFSDSSRSYAVGGAGRPGEATDNAKYYKEQAANSAASAAQSAGYSSHPPRIHSSGYWEIWNGTAYEVTEYPAKGESGLPAIVTDKQPNWGIWEANKEYRFGSITTDLGVLALTNSDLAHAPVWSLQFTVDKDNFRVYGTGSTLPFEWYLAEPQFVRGNTYLLTFVEMGSKKVCVWMEVAA